MSSFVILGSVKPFLIPSFTQATASTSEPKLFGISSGNAGLSECPLATLELPLCNGVEVDGIGFAGETGASLIVVPLVVDTALGIASSFWTFGSKSITKLMLALKDLNTILVSVCMFPTFSELL